MFCVVEQRANPQLESTRGRHQLRDMHYAFSKESSKAVLRKIGRGREEAKGEKEGVLKKRALCASLSFSPLSISLFVCACAAVSMSLPLAHL